MVFHLAPEAQKCFFKCIKTMNPRQGTLQLPKLVQIRWTLKYMGWNFVFTYAQLCVKFFHIVDSLYIPRLGVDKSLQYVFLNSSIWFWPRIHWKILFLKQWNVHNEIAFFKIFQCLSYFTYKTRLIFHCKPKFAMDFRHTWSFSPKKINPALSLLIFAQFVHIYQNAYKKTSFWECKFKVVRMTYTQIYAHTSFAVSGYIYGFVRIDFRCTYRNIINIKICNFTY